MNKTAKRVLALVLALMMMVSVFAACGNDSGNSSTSSTPESSAPESSSSEPADESSEVSGEEPSDTAWEAPQPPEGDDYDAISDYYYDYTLGDFWAIYQNATAEVDNMSLRYAQEAIAEAKLLESGIMMPTTGYGGNYAISRAVPGSLTTHAFGSDQHRFQYAIVADKLVKKEDRDEVKKILNENKGTGTARQKIQDYLTGAGYQLMDKYVTTFSELPSTWDVHNSSSASDTEPLVKTIDGLLFFDCEDRELPALAESYEVSEDGLTYTFHIRKGVKWVDSQGREVAEVKADDWVAGLQHAADCGQGLADLFIGILPGIEDYINGKTNDFSTVGISAPDDYTLVYTLEKKAPFFTTMLHYSNALPMCRSYYESQGGKFGVDFDPEPDSYQYASDPDHILYCGAFLITNATEDNSIDYKLNPTYWDAENVTIKEFKYMFNDGSDVLKSYNDTLAGTQTSAGLNASAMAQAKQDTLEGDAATIFETYGYVAYPNVTTYVNFTNVNRQRFGNYTDETKVVSSQSEEEAARTHLAINNRHFRLALAMAADRIAWNAQSVGDDLAAVSVRNSYTPATFCELEEEVTVDINGTPTTFPAGTDYGEIVQAQLDADGMKITVYKKDPNAENGKGTGDGFDGWYNPTEAAAELELAIAELETAGVTIDENNPIQLDLPAFVGGTMYLNRANAYKQSVEASLGGKVTINITAAEQLREWYDAVYFPKVGSDMNYDLNDFSGWGPDYLDPCSYLDTMRPNYNGFMTKTLGIY